MRGRNITQQEKNKNKNKNKNSSEEIWELDYESMIIWYEASLTNFALERSQRTLAYLESLEIQNDCLPRVSTFFLWD